MKLRFHLLRPLASGMAWTLADGGSDIFTKPGSPLGSRLSQRVPVVGAVGIPQSSVPSVLSKFTFADRWALRGATPPWPLVLSGIVLEVCAIVELTRTWGHAGHLLPETSLEAGVLVLVTGLGRPISWDRRPRPPCAPTRSLPYARRVPAAVVGHTSIGPWKSCR